jgi:hypothetical protein
LNDIAVGERVIVYDFTKKQHVNKIYAIRQEAGPMNEPIKNFVKNAFSIDGINSVEKRNKQCNKKA